MSSNSSKLPKVLSAPIHTDVAKPLLLVGIGGGYDVFAALPLYAELQSNGCNCHLANLSFTKGLLEKCSRQISEAMVEVHKDDFADDAFVASLGFPANYFPELHLSRATGKSIFCAPCDTKLDLLIDAFTVLVEKLGICQIILCDAGVDSLLLYDEESLGTPAEDLLTMLAIQDVCKMRELTCVLMCVGAGTEDGISERHFFTNWSEIIRSGGYLGSSGWTFKLEAVRWYRDIFSACVPTNSTIHSQIVAALEGHEGHMCPDAIRSRYPGRDPDSAVCLSPLMTLCWYFTLAEVLAAKRIDLTSCAEAAKASGLFGLQMKIEALRQQKGWVGVKRNEARDWGYIGPRKYDPILERAGEVIE